MKNVKKQADRKKGRVKMTVFTLLTASLAVLAAFFAFNTDIIAEYFGCNPCVSGISRNPLQWWNWNSKNRPGNPSESFEDYISDTVFIGDSRTVGLSLYRYIKPENVYAKNGQNHQGARTEHFVDLGTGRLLTVAEAVAVTKPKRIIVSYGINGVAFFGREAFIEQYSYLIDDLQNASPDSLIIIQSILPVSDYYQKYVDTRVNNDTIDSYNLLLKQLAEEKNCTFLDTSSLFKNSSNCLAVEYDIGDGIHLSRYAYEVFLQHLDQNRVY